MKILADTHLLLWAADHPHQLSLAARSLLTDETNEIFFSPLSIWEVVVKGALGRDDFQFNPGKLHRYLLENGFRELPVTSEHALAVQQLPPFHKDPVDRLLIAQATAENMLLMTSDDKIAQYPGPIRKV